LDKDTANGKKFAAKIQSLCCKEELQMKAVRKFLVIALAGVLALSVLTGCGGGGGASGTSVIDALNYWAEFYNERYVFKAGDSALQTKTNELAATIEESAKELDFSSAKTTEDIVAIVKDDVPTMQKIDAVLNFPQAKIGDGSPLYMFGLSEMSLPADWPRDKMTYYAHQLYDEAEDVNAPDKHYEDPNWEPDWTYGDEFYASVATVTVAGRQYMIALFKTTAIPYTE
jgi:hypothetical protein